MTWGGGGPSGVGSSPRAWSGGRIRWLACGVAVLLPTCTEAPRGSPPSESASGPDTAAVVADGDGSATRDAVRPDRIESELTRGDTVPGWPSWTRQDLAVFVATLEWARAEGLDTLDTGERVARIGQRFVGSPYVPQTLDPPGPERLVINLRAFDCVTFVETALALAQVLGHLPLQTGAVAEEMALYQEILTRIRYRGGRLAGYPSRLHYFSEWIADNEAKGLVVDVTARLGGVRDPEPPTFMTAHRDAYRQLEDPAIFEAVREMEASLADAPRFVLPEARIPEVEDQIRTGDIIAATSSLAGLDVAHTGIALRSGGVLRLMHAPLVGEAVQISDVSLGERLSRLETQDGIMVARPRPTHSTSAGTPQE